MKMENRQLISLALKARENAYSPYSGFAVGAALLTNSGKVYTGCNIENAAFSPTNCAERTAFFKAVSEGERNFVKIALAGGKAGLPPREICTPCGVCRQVMTEFCTGDFQIICAVDKDNFEVFGLSQLMPNSFSKAQI